MDFTELPPEKGIELLKLLFSEASQKDWIRIGTLRPEDKTKRATMLSEAAVLFRELKEIEARKKVLMAERDSISTKWWNHIQKTYGVSPEKNITITDEGFILVEPKRKPKGEV